MRSREWAGAASWTEVQECPAHDIRCLPKRRQAGNVRNLWQEMLKLLCVNKSNESQIKPKHQARFGGFQGKKANGVVGGWQYKEKMGDGVRKGGRGEGRPRKVSSQSFPLLCGTAMLMHTRRGQSC
jgi:hypothetical protein